MMVGRVIRVEPLRRPSDVVFEQADGPGEDHVRRAFSIVWANWYLCVRAVLGEQYNSVARRGYRSKDPNKPQRPELYDTKDTGAMSRNGLMGQQERREGSVGGKEGMVVGEDCQLQAVVYSDAVEDAREMILHGPLAHRKLLSDFLVGAARHDPFDNLQIAG
jgi:hypothetical protein